MFERFTEPARRAIFFARFEASVHGSPHIEADHLLLGLLREDRQLTQRWIGAFPGLEALRNEIASRYGGRERVASSIDLPLSTESIQALGYADEESRLRGDRHIAPVHVFLGLLRVESSFAVQVLRERGVTYDSVHQQAPSPAEPVGPNVEPSDRRTRQRLCLRNPGVSQVMLCVEPWGHRYSVAPGDQLEIAFHGPNEGIVEIEHGVGEITLRAQPDSTYSVLPS